MFSEFLFKTVETMSTKGEHHTVPLSVLLKRESANEKIDNPELVHGQANQSKKGEDFTLVKTECQRVMGDGVTTFSVFGVFILLSFLASCCIPTNIFYNLNAYCV